MVRAGPDAAVACVFAPTAPGRAEGTVDEAAPGKAELALAGLGAAFPGSAAESKFAALLGSGDEACVVGVQWGAIPWTGGEELRWLERDSQRSSKSSCKDCSDWYVSYVREAGAHR